MCNVLVKLLVAKVLVQLPVVQILVLVQTWMVVSLETVRVTGSPPVIERTLMYILAPAV